MPTPVPISPQSARLDRLCVGRAVSALHGARWVSQIAHLAGRHGHRVVSHAVQALASRASSTKRVRVHYLRSLSAHVALLAIELRRDATYTLGGASIGVGGRATIAVTLPAGAVWIDDGPPEAPLDGSTPIPLPSPYTSGRRWLYGLIDVSACSQTSLGTLTIEITGHSGATHEGLGTVQLVELPLATLRPEDGEAGLLLSWTDPRNHLEEGAGAPPVGPTGLSAIVELEQRLAVRQRWWWQILGYEDASPTTGGDTWYRTGSMGALDWRGALGSAYSPIWRLRTRRLYESGYACTAVVRYYAASGGKVRLTTTPIGGAPSSVDIVCATSAAWSTASAALTLPTTGTGQQIELSIEAEGNSGSTIYLSNATIHSNETI